MNAMATIMNVVPGLLARNLSGEAIMDALWPAFQMCITSGAKHEIDMPMALATLVGERGVGLLKARFCELIQAPVTAVEDHARGIMLIAPQRPTLGHQTIVPGVQQPKVKNLRQAKVARPANAFILYRKHHHPQIKAKQPDIHNNQISVIVGEKWRNEDKAVKARFETLAKQMKAKHLLEHPDYQYKPRKPSEKKRRMTRRKQAALVSTVRSNSKSAVTSTSTSTTPNPEIPKTASGNAMLDLGTKDLDFETLEAMLIDYNSSFDASAYPVAAILAEGTTSVIYDEPTEEAQNDSNFYHIQHDFPHFTTAEEAGLGTDDSLENVDYFSGFRASTTAFDEHNQTYQNAALVRMWNSMPALPEMSETDEFMSTLAHI